MFISCSNKGCFKTTEALLDEKTDEVICRECGKAIPSVTSFAKVSLKTLGQTTKTQKKAKALEFDCGNCRKKVQAVVKNGKIVCTQCGKEMKNVPVSFKAVIEMMGKKDV